MNLAHQIDRAIDEAPPSLLLGLMVRDARLRERSRERLANLIAQQLSGEGAGSDHRQLDLLF